LELGSGSTITGVRVQAPNTSKGCVSFPYFAFIVLCGVLSGLLIYKN